MILDMKYNIILLSLCMLGVCCLTSCREDDLDPESVITVEHQTQNAFDKWLEANYVDPYNIQVKYRYEMDEAGYTYYTIPAKLEYSIIMAHLVKYLCIDTYDEVAGINFTRSYFPKMFFYTGEWEYKNNGTFILGTAEGGKKIFLAGLNYLPTYMASASTLNHYYIKTIHHEFTHILNQTKDFPTEFTQVSGTSYVTDDWSSSSWNTYYLQRGFISTYSQDSAREDFAEMMSLYITNTEETFNAWLEAAGRTVTEDDMSETANSHYTEFHTSFPDLKVGDTFPGAGYLQTKVDLVRKYMKNTFQIDIDQLRDVIMRRQAEVVSGNVDLTTTVVD